MRRTANAFFEHTCKIRGIPKARGGSNHSNWELRVEQQYLGLVYPHGREILVWRQPVILFKAADKVIAPHMAEGGQLLDGEILLHVVFLDIGMGGCGMVRGDPGKVQGAPQVVEQAVDADLGFVAPALACKGVYLIAQGQDVGICVEDAAPVLRQMHQDLIGQGARLLEPDKLKIIGHCPGEISMLDIEHQGMSFLHGVNLRVSVYNPASAEAVDE